MKIRQGFVSNSSSSSFIVQVRESFISKNLKSDKKGFLATQEDINKITDYGFGATTISNPHDYKDYTCGGCSDCNCDNKRKDEDFLDYMGYWVSCNEDEVLEFLIKNNIPFKASCHYDHQYYQYQKDDDYILYCYNYGLNISMYGYKEYDDCLNFYPEEPIKKISKSEFIGKDNEN